jgi:hypothetical protein
VAVASTLFTILSIDAFPVIGDGPRDTARVALTVSGVGFLGTGALIRGRSGVKGLTTASEIWLMAAIGMAVGAGAYAAATLHHDPHRGPVVRPAAGERMLASKAPMPERAQTDEPSGDDLGLGRGSRSAWSWPVP